MKINTSLSMTSVETSVEGSTAEPLANRSSLLSAGLLSDVVSSRGVRCFKHCCNRIFCRVSLALACILSCIAVLIFLRHDGTFDFPPELEFIYVRHGQSTINKPLDTFNRLTYTFCESKSRAGGPSSRNVPAEVCDKHNRTARNANKRASWISKNGRRSDIPNDLIAAANKFLEAREFFDAPLTKDGLLEAQHLNESTERLQLRWLAENSEHSGTKTILVSSNLIRAVDTLLNGFALLANSALPVFLHTALQEYSLSGNGDVVSVFLPLGLDRDKKNLSSIRMWKRVSKRRIQGYRDAGMLNYPWAPLVDDFSNLAWFRQRNFKLASVNHSHVDFLVNHDWYLPNSLIDKGYHREAPEDVETVRLGTEYTEHGVLGDVRFYDFKTWVDGMFAEQRGLERMVVVAHSTWFRDFVKYVQKRGGLSHSSCRVFGRGARLHNTAMVRIAQGRCSCEFNGTDFGGPCFQSH